MKYGEIDHEVGETAHGGLRNFAPERRQGIQNSFAITLGDLDGVVEEALDAPC